MAAALLIGTSAWAYEVPGDGTLAAAFAEAVDGEEILVTGPLSYTITDADDQIVLDENKHIYLNLNGNVILINNCVAAKNAGITIKQGVLEITGTGTIQNNNQGSEANYTSDLIRVHGGDASVQINAQIAEPYSQLIVNSGVTLINQFYKNKVVNNVETDERNLDVKCNTVSITEKSGSNPALANGARVDVYGHLNASTYGIKVNGSIKRPASADYSPFVYIHSGAEVRANDNLSNAVAAYSSGYGRWIIEGLCQGSTGLYAKGGKVEINGGTIKSENTTNTTPTGKSSGVSAGGSAIVVESNTAYPGDIAVTITAGSTVHAESGYAIEENLTTTEDKIEMISIQGGSIEGGDAGAVIIKDATKDEVTVVGGTIDGNVQAGTTVYTTATAMEAFLPGGDNSDDAYVVTATKQQDNTYVYTVVPDKSKAVTINAYGWSTFSAPYDRKVPSGLTAYLATYTENAETIELVPLNGYIPAGTGVILAGTSGSAYTLSGNVTSLDPADNLANNKLQPYTAWASHSENIYVLVGGELYKYTGTDMKEYKAYLDLGTQQSPFGAPKRIQMVIAETQDIENVEFEAVKAVKFIENGQVLIKRGEKVYNVQGQIVK
jgi:hypothetical protein